MCIKCEEFGADHDTPTEPPLSVNDFRYVRKWDTTMDELVFVPVTTPQVYTSYRPGKRRRELRQAITQAIIMMSIGSLLVIGYLEYLLDFS